MKQKIVLKVIAMADDKCRKKALSVAVGLSGVISVAIAGEDKRQLEVIGDDVDIAELTNLLRKKVGHAEIASVGPHPPPEKKPEEKKPEEKKPPQPLCFCQHQPCVCGWRSVPWAPIHPQPVWIGEPIHCQEPSCTIM